MPERFRICKRAPGMWELLFPAGFDRFGRASQCYSTFENAVAAYVYEQQRECPMCLKGAVVDTDWGWQCEACGSCDVAVGCKHPSEEQADERG